MRDDLYDRVKAVVETAAALLLPEQRELERRMSSDAMQAAGGNRSEAARPLGVSRVGLIKNLTRLGLR